ncbi:MAG: hypothetical protein Q4G64_08725 [bacterium]|nr:hypothetical protein [bacterium]
MLGLVVFVGVFAAAVWGVTTFLNASQQAPPANACVAVLPDGTRHSLSAEQARNAALIGAIGIERDLPARAVTIALATARQESWIINIDYGDRDSIGLFQQRPSQGWGTVEQIMDPFYSTNAFYDGLLKVPGWETMEITVAAQAVQRSGFPDAYAQHEGMARAYASALTGHSTAALACDLPVEEEAALAPVMGGLLDFGVAPGLAPALDADGAPLQTADGRTLFTLDAPALTGIGEPARAAWAAGHWAVATATESGVSNVVVGGQLWVNGSLEWVDAGDLAQQEGTVLIG